MRKCIAVFLIAALALGLSVPAFAEPQYVTTVFLPPEKDEAYWEREFRLNKEQDWEVNGLPAYDGPSRTPSRSISSGRTPTCPWKPGAAAS